MKEYIKGLVSLFGWVALAVFAFVVAALVAEANVDKRDAAEETCKPHKVLTTYEYEGEQFVVCLGHEVKEVKSELE